MEREPSLAASGRAPPKPPLWLACRRLPLIARHSLFLARPSRRRTKHASRRARRCRWSRSRCRRTADSRSRLHSPAPHPSRCAPGNPWAFSTSSPALGWSGAAERLASVPLRRAPFAARACPDSTPRPMPPSLLPPQGRRTCRRPCPSMPCLLCDEGGSVPPKSARRDFHTYRPLMHHRLPVWAGPSNSCLAAVVRTLGCRA